MKALLLTFLIPFAAHAWQDGVTTLEIDLANVAGKPGQFAILPVFGLKAYPDLSLSRAVLESPELQEALVKTVPRDHELIPFLKLTPSQLEADAAESVASAVRAELTSLQSKTPKDAARMKAWEIINKNARQTVRVTLKLHTKYEAVDFEVVSTNGENDDRRAACIAGFRQTAQFELTKIEFPGIKALTAAVQPAVGTRFEPNRTFFGPGVTFLERKIDLSPEQGAAFARECKDQRKL